MLVSFKISNFLSFNKEQSFSMVPSLENENKTHLNIIKNVRLLKMGTILGANSSGKSNLLKALAIGSSLINGASVIKYRNFFSKIHKENIDKETLFEYSFYFNNVFYTYGFTINLNSGKFLTEYLYFHDQETDQEKVIFERVSEASELESLFSYKIDLTSSIRKKLNKYIQEFSDNSDILFITKLNLDKNLTKYLKEFSDVFNYFNTKINVYFQNQDFKIYDLSLSREKKEVNNLLNIFDTGISDLIFEEIDINVLETNFNDSIDELIKFIEAKKEENNFAFSVRIKHSLFEVEYNQGSLKIYKILLKHLNADYAFEFNEESDGIRRLFDLFDILLVPRLNSIYIFDELSRSIHPLLIHKFIEYFNKNLLDFPVQLVFTTHEANILKESILRKDEIWFVEKENDNSSKLYSLDIFKLTNKKILDSYLDGNYGAVPIFLKDDK